MDNDDSQIRRFYLIYFLAVIFVIFSFTGSVEKIILGICLSLLLTYTLPHLMNLVSTACASLTYGFDYADSCYENQVYQNDMDKATRLIREEKCIQAITAYRKIVQQVPNKCEARLNLARIYKKVGHFGLALSEYQKIVDLKNELGRDHVYVLESERAINELKE